MTRCCRRVRYAVILLLAVAIALSCSLVLAQEDADGAPADDVGASDANDASATASDASQQSSGTAEAPPKPQRDPPSGNEDDWGSFYDPNNVFCGKYDCYKILGFDHMTWGSDPPSLKDITKSYRSLSRRWHPDKNKAKGAREKFVVRVHIMHTRIILFHCRDSHLQLANLYCGDTSYNAGHCQSVRDSYRHREAKGV